MGLMDVSCSYKKNNITFLIFGLFTNYIDSVLCFLNNNEKWTYLVITPGLSIKSPPIRKLNIRH